MKFKCKLKYRKDYFIIEAVDENHAYMILDGLLYHSIKRFHGRLVTLIIDDTYPITMKQSDLQNLINFFEIKEL